MGIVNGQPLLDLKYDEDKDAEVDMNVVMLEDGGFVEVQGTAEVKTYSRQQMHLMLDLAELGICLLIATQKEVLGNSLAG